MKTVLLSVGFAVLTGSALADLPLGRGEISATGIATTTFDSNVFGTHDATSDFSETLVPRLSYQRKAAQIQAEANAQVSFIRFLDQTRLNADNLALDAALRIPPAEILNYSGLLSASYVEKSDVNTDINARINTKVTTLAAQTALTTGPRSDVSVSGNYQDSRPSVGSSQKMLTTGAVYDYKDFFEGNSLRLSADYDKLQTSGGNALGVPLDQNSYTFSAGLNRAFANDALRAGINYGYRVLNRSAAEVSTGAPRQGGSVFTATLDGPFLPEKYFPKVTSQFALSYQNAATPGINDTGTKELTGSLLLSWQAREDTKVSLSAHRAQRLSVQDLSVVTTDVQLGIEQAFRYNLTGSVAAGYTWATFRSVDRKDKTATLSAGLQYHFGKAWDASLNYSLNSTKSTVLQSTFDRNLVSLALTYRF